MSSKKTMAREYSEARTWAKDEIKRRQAEATLVDLPVEQAHDVIRRIRDSLWPEGKKEPDYAHDVVVAVAAVLNNRGLGLGLGLAEAQANAVDPREGRTPMTNAEDVKDGGFCPFCRSGEIQGGPTTVGGCGVSQKVTCATCGESWTASYTLTGYVVEVTACPPGVTVEIH